MELKKQDVGVWVKASEELSTHMDKVCCRRTDFKHFFSAYWDNSRRTYVTFNENNSWISKEEIEWLKPIEQVYPMTENQLFEFATLLLADIAIELKTSGGYGGEQCKNFIQTITK